MQAQRQIDLLLAQRAAEWIETLKSGDERNRMAFVQWLRQSKLHVEHYLEMIAIDRELQQFDPAQGEDVDALLKRIAPNVVPLERHDGGRIRATTTSARRRLFLISAALAASMALCALAFLWRFEIERRNEFTTVAGEQRTFTLADGSLVSLNVASSMRVDFSSNAREIDLKSGEAVFKVAHDSSRPFVVHTHTATVRALGTQFNVDQRLDDTVVSVLEGRVQVTALPSDSQRGEAKTQSLNAGEEVEVASSGRMEKQTHPDVNKAIAWRERRLIFEETPLEDIVREFHRYDPSIQIIIEGITPGSRRYGGIFDANDPNSFIDLLSREPDLSIERRKSEIVIRKR